MNIKMMSHILLKVVREAVIPVDKPVVVSALMISNANLVMSVCSIAESVINEIVNMTIKEVVIKKALLKSSS